MLLLHLVTGWVVPLSKPLRNFGKRLGSHHYTNALRKLKAAPKIAQKCQFVALSQPRAKWSVAPRLTLHCDQLVGGKKRLGLVPEELQHLFTDEQPERDTHTHIHTHTHTHCTALFKATVEYHCKPQTQPHTHTRVYFSQLHTGWLTRYSMKGIC